MRPLWRNTLWLLLAATCGALGYWQGIGKGAEIIGSISASNDAADAFSDISRALEVLDKSPEDTYARNNLQAALFNLGMNDRALAGWWSCRESYPGLLKRAANYASAGPTRNLPEFDAFLARGLRICESVKRASS
jgi:hypothetical protein